MGKSPFLVKKKISLRARNLDSEPIKEYGGWGIKGKFKSKAYNVSGNIGLQLYLKNGRKVLFGTQRQEAIENAMKKLMNIN